MGRRDNGTKEIEDEDGTIEGYVGSFKKTATIAATAMRRLVEMPPWLLPHLAAFAATSAVLALCWKTIGGHLPQEYFVINVGNAVDSLIAATFERLQDRVEKQVQPEVSVRLFLVIT